MEAKFYSQTCTLSIQLERLVSTFDGTDQLAKAISRIISNWDDVWGDFSISISSKMVTKDWGSVAGHSVTIGAPKFRVSTKGVIKKIA